MVDRIAWIVFENISTTIIGKVYEFDELHCTERGIGDFGSETNF